MSQNSITQMSTPSVNDLYLRAAGITGVPDKIDSKIELTELLNSVKSAGYDVLSINWEDMGLKFSDKKLEIVDAEISNKNNDDSQRLSKNAFTYCYAGASTAICAGLGFLFGGPIGAGLGACVGALTGIIVGGNMASVREEKYLDEVLGNNY